MKTERELFLYELEGRGFSFKDKSYDEFGFTDEVLNMVWEMWQAATQREGFKWVPVDATPAMLNAGYNVKHSGEISLANVYKATIGVCDD